jgi:hypothetical protein
MGLKKRNQDEIISDLHKLVHEIEHEQHLKERQKKKVK